MHLSTIVTTTRTDSCRSPTLGLLWQQRAINPGHRTPSGIFLDSSIPFHLQGRNPRRGEFPCCCLAVLSWTFHSLMLWMWNDQYSEAVCTPYPMESSKERNNNNFTEFPGYQYSEKNNIQEVFGAFLSLFSNTWWKKIRNNV